MSGRPYLHTVAALALAFLLSACGAIGPEQIGTLTGASNGTPVSTSKTAPASSAQLRFAAGDKIRVTVFGEDKLSGEYQIDTAGSVSLPLAGTIEAAGL